MHWRCQGLAVSPLDAGDGTAKFDLTLDLREESEGLSGSLEYNTDLFERATIERLAGHFTTLLAEHGRRRQKPISPSLRCSTQAEREQLLVEWNATAADYPQERVRP